MFVLIASFQFCARAAAIAKSGREFEVMWESVFGYAGIVKGLTVKYNRNNKHETF